MTESKPAADGQPEERKVSKAVHKRRQIKEVKTKLGNLSPAAAAEVVNEVVAQQARKQIGGFGAFIREQGVVGVGVGLVLGIQMKAVVDTIMASFINPLTELLPGGQSLAARTATLVDRPGKEDTVIAWGAIVYSILTFIIVAAIIYAAYRGLKLDKFKKDK
jgi:large-conductance mechanosensitive channel